MNEILVEILIILALVMANGLFAMSEMALISSRRSRLQQRAEEGDKGAQAALNLLASPNRFLSTVQIGISLIGVLSGAVAGATLSENLAAWLVQFPGLAPYAEAISLAAIVLVITYFSLVIGELIPKRLGMNAPEKTAASVSRFMSGLSRLATPLVAVLSASTEAGLRILGVKPGTERLLTGEEIRITLREGASQGLIQEEEQDMLESVFRLGARRIDALMTPRTEISFLRLDDPLEVVIARVKQDNFSRYPVMRDNPDEIAGILAIRDLFDIQLSGTTADLEAALSPAVYIPGSTPALKLLEIFRSTNSEMALVIDEFGGVMGLVTPYDILTSVAGDIGSQVSGQVSGASKQPDGSWIFDGMYQIDELKEDLQLDALPEEDHAGYQTAGGFMMTSLGAIPRPGDSFEHEGYRFEVLSMDGRRVESIRVVPAPLQDGAA